MWGPSILVLPPPGKPTLLQYYCTTIALYTPPHRPPPWYAIHHTILVMAISCKRQVGLYTILPLPILCGIYCNNGGSEENSILRNRVGDAGGRGGAQTVGAQRIVLIRAQQPRNKTISCIGQKLSSTWPATSRAHSQLSCSHPYVLNGYSHIPGTQPHEHEYRILPGEPCIRQEHVHILGYCIHKTG